VAGGCAFDTPQTSLVPHSDFARSILYVYGITTWVSLGIALLVFVVLGVIILRFRDRPGAAPPAQTRGNTALEISWTVAPALVLLVIAIPTIQIIFRTQGPAAPKDALEITVRGWQWWWEFRYPAFGVAVANEAHVPVGRPVVFNLEGPDVIHSFWIPPLGGKRDVVPGRLNRLSLIPDTPGEYPGQCAEFCGASHALMGMRVIVDTPDRFEQWLAAQRAPAAEPSGDAAEGKTVFTTHACVGCHTIRGVSSGALAPDLTHFGSRAWMAGGMLPVDVATVAAWVKDPARFKPAVKMPALGLTDAEARAVATYLVGLK
jgi:cytochrome c oxidase subunit II